MLITIFGASGKVGRLTVAEALARGHSVRAFVHRANNLPDDPLLQIVRGDIHDPQAVYQAVHGSQAVISALGSWGTTTKDIVTTGTANIIPAMKHANVGRIVTLTGSDAWDITDKEPSLIRRITHSVAGLAAGKILADGENHIRLLRKSDLDWTTLRSPVMTSNARIFYKLSMRPPVIWKTVSRPAVAKALLDQLESPTYSKAAPFLHGN